MDTKGVWACALALAVLGGGSVARAAPSGGADAWDRGDYAAAVHQWEASAASGDAEAQYRLGEAYRLGRGVPQDLARAEHWFGLAAARGHAEASDLYGLMLFDRGERARAMPYVRAAADRGDARARYLLAIAHFNGDVAPRDWVRAYALMTLANRAGLPQASAAIAQMDQAIPLPQRQAATLLAAQLGDAGSGTGAGVAQHPSAPLMADETAGAPLADPPPVPLPVPPPIPAPAKLAKAAPSSSVAAARPDRPVASGPWRVQFGVFSQKANADALWQQLGRRPELAAHRRIDVPSGRLTKLSAGGFPTQAAAARACSSLQAAGFPCLAVRD